MNSYNLRSKTNKKLTYYEQKKEKTYDYSFQRFMRNLKGNYNNTPDNIYYHGYIHFTNNYKCNWCGSKKHLRIDHDHNSGRYRGCLCNDCNGVEGRIKNLSYEYKIRYLTSYKQRSDDRNPWNVYQAKWIVDTWYRDGGMLGSYKRKNRNLRNRKIKYALI